MLLTLLASCGARQSSTTTHKPEESGKMLGLRTVIYAAPDLVKAKQWYAQVLGIEPYFDQPFYVGFNVGGYELGLDPDAKPGGTGVIAYWGVEDADAEHRRLLKLGAKEHQPVKEVGQGIRTGTVLDPWGNVFGVIHNPHFKR
jgi:predicted enzyme related to lactoylglutathione lyase